VNFHDVTNDRRMVRSFSGEPVDDEVLRRILSSARRSPTAGNTDGWALVVLRGASEMEALWHSTTTDDWRLRARRWRGLSRAPVAIVVLTSPHRYVDRYSEPDKASSGLGVLFGEDPSGSNAQGRWPIPFWFVDAGHVVMSLLLAAVDEGLGACFLGNFRGENALLQTLGIPDQWRYVGSVLLGRPAGDDPPSESLRRPQRSIDDLVHFGRW